MQVIVDRFEGDYAVVEKEEGVFYNMPKALLVGAKEGDVIDIVINHEETEKLREEVDDLINGLFID